MNKRSVLLWLLVMATPSMLVGASATVFARDTSVADTVAMVAAGMKQNYEAIEDLSMTVTKHSRIGRETSVQTAHFKWIRPGIFRGDLLPSSSNDIDSKIGEGALHVHSNGSTVTELLEESEQTPVDYHNVGRILAASGSYRDMRGIAAFDPRNIVYGTFVTPLWDSLQRDLTSGENISIDKEPKFGVDGLSVRIKYKAGNAKYLWIDTRHGNMPRIITHRVSSASWITTEVQEVQESGGIWFPMRISNRGHGLPNMPEDPELTYIISDLKLNEGIDPSALVIRFKPGTLVIDEINNRRYVVKETLRYIIVPAILGACSMVAGGIWLMIVRKRARREIERRVR